MQFKKIAALLIVLLSISCGTKKPTVKMVSKPRTVVAKTTPSVPSKTTNPITKTEKKIRNLRKRMK